MRCRRRCRQPLRAQRGSQDDPVEFSNHRDLTSLHVDTRSPDVADALRRDSAFRRGRGYFFASAFQFVITVIGAALASSTLTLIRKRPSGATSYCCRYPATLGPVLAALRRMDVSEPLARTPLHRVRRLFREALRTGEIAGELAVLRPVVDAARAIGARRQLVLPVGDNYSCRRRVSKGASPTTWRHSVVVVGRSVVVEHVRVSAGAPAGAEAPRRSSPRGRSHA